MGNLSPGIISRLLPPDLNLNCKYSTGEFVKWYFIAGQAVAWTPPSEIVMELYMYIHTCTWICRTVHYSL